MKHKQENLYIREYHLQYIMFSCFYLAFLNLVWNTFQYLDFVLTIHTCLLCDFIHSYIVGVFEARFDS